ncbi:YfhO family protein [Candidatus Parcubacteria bacterium]|nr:YfhO family protein [Patescibacteria group bacterium]MCG2689512.1 YfhO family protein [Candidatus Parcubacteria bacterium]
MTSNKKALVGILFFILLIFVRNIALWSQEQTFIFADTAIYALQLSAFSQNITSIFSQHSSFLGWNPNYLSTGIPTLSVVDFGYLYPPDFVIALISKIFGNSLLVFPFTTLLAYLHLAFGAFFVYKILKDYFKLENYSSLFGGLLWVITGYNLEYLAATSVLYAGSYLPVCFYLNLKRKEKDEFRYFFLFYLLLAFSFLAGYPMPSVLIVLTVTTYNILTGDKIKYTLISVIKDNLRGLFLITFPLISPLYFSAIANFPQSVRGTVLTLEGFISNPIKIFNLAEGILPVNTLFNTASSTNIVHLSLSTVVLIILLQAKNKGEVFRDKRLLSLLALAIFGAILSAGGTTYFPTLIYLTTPIISFFRRLAVFSLIPGFAVCLIAPFYIKNALGQRGISQPLGFGIKIFAILALVTQAYKIAFIGKVEILNYPALVQNLSIIFVIGMLSVLSFIVYHKNKRIGFAILGFALIVESGTLVASKVYLNSKTNPEAVFQPNELTNYLKENTKPGERVDMLFTQHSYSTDYLGLEQTAGYMSLASEYGVRINELLPLPQSQYDSKSLRDILGVKYIVRKGDWEDTNLKKVAEIKQNPLKPNFYSFDYNSLSWWPDPVDTYYSVYQNPTALPRLYLASNIIPTARQSKYLLPYFEKLEDPKTVFLEADKLQPGKISPEGEVVIKDYQRNYIKAEVTAEKQTFLANSTGFYPGWKARINGTKVAPIRTNWFMMGVYLPAGENTVEFIYTPYEANIGLLYIILATTYWFFSRILRHKYEQTL